MFARTCRIAKPGQSWRLQLEPDALTPPLSLSGGTVCPALTDCTRLYLALNSHTTPQSATVRRKEKKWTIQKMENKSENWEEGRAIMSHACKTRCFNLIWCFIGSETSRGTSQSVGLSKVSEKQSRKRDWLCLLAAVLVVCLLFTGRLVPLHHL